MTVKISEKIVRNKVRNAGKAPIGGLPIADSEFREVMQNAWDIHSKL